jgi:hypothetical protein
MAMGIVYQLPNVARAQAIERAIAALRAANDRPWSTDVETARRLLDGLRRHV